VLQSAPNSGLHSPYTNTRTNPNVLICECTVIMMDFSNSYLTTEKCEPMTEHLTSLSIFQREHGNEKI
jgi:hypothetical protein